eukprot:scaffold185504_cov55-Attheya_sp.AAC.1
MSLMPMVSLPVCPCPPSWPMDAGRHQVGMLYSLTPGGPTSHGCRESVPSLCHEVHQVGQRHVG